MKTISHLNRILMTLLCSLQKKDINLMNISSVPFEVLWPFINIYKYQNQLDTMKPPAAQLQHEAATGGVQQK